MYLFALGLRFLIKQLFVLRFERIFLRFVFPTQTHQHRGKKACLNDYHGKIAFLKKTESKEQFDKTISAFVDQERDVAPW